MYQLVFLLSGLAFFLFGMQLLGKLLGSFTGGDLDEKLAKYTKNDFVKLVVGFVVTTLFQSSSATTVIMVSMTSVGLISVAESLSFILGANIGSITTAWIVAVKITKAGIFLFTIGIIGRFISSNKKLGYIFDFLAGLGLIFFGLEMMSDSLEFIKKSPEVVDIISNFSAETSIGSMLILVLFGIVFTAVIQSSGATAAMVITIASQGILDLHSACAVVLGSTLGTTITAFLASLNAGALGKRTAFMQFFINVIGTLFGIVFFYPIVTLIAGKFPPATAVSLIIATYMTFLKIVLVIIVFPIRKYVAKFSEMLIREKFQTINIKPRTPKLPYDAGSLVIASNLNKNVDTFMKYLTDMIAFSYIIMRKPKEHSLFDKVVKYEKTLDLGHRKMVQSISASGNSRNALLWLYLKMSDEAESMGDHARSIAKYGIKLGELDFHFSDDQKQLMLEAHTKIFLQFHEVCIKKNYDTEFLENSHRIERFLRTKKRELYTTLCMETGHNPEKRLVLTDILSEYSKINHSIKRILQVNLDTIEGRGIYLWEKKHVQGTDVTDSGE